MDLRQQHQFGHASGSIGVCEPSAIQSRSKYALSSGYPHIREIAWAMPGDEIDD